MEIKEEFLVDILKSEKNMVLSGADKYGDYFKHAVEFSNLLDNSIESIDDLSKYIAVAFLSQVRKHQTLALFSAVRRHHTQMSMDLRQVLEAASWMAYAMAFDEQEKFCKKDVAGNLCITDKLEKAKNDWLDNNYKVKSDEIKRLKQMINEATAHANVIYTFQNFETLTDGRHGFYTPFFDFEDDYKVKTDLWLVANIALGLLDLLYEVNRDYDVFKFADELLDKREPLVKKNNELKAEMMKHERFKAAQKKEGLSFANNRL